MDRTPFHACTRRARRLAKKLHRKLRRLARLTPDKVPVLILGKRKRRLVVMERDDATFLRE
jgi:hypothetical protein